MTLKSTTMLTKQKEPLKKGFHKLVKSLSVIVEEWKPHPYQKKAIKFLLTHAAGGLLLDPGLGKTSITLAAIKILKNEKIFQKALVIAPLRICHSVWPQEIAKWKNFNSITYTILHGKDKDKNLQLDVDIFLINPEGLPWLLHNPKIIKDLGIDTLVIDESSKFKKTNTVRFKLLKPAINKFSRRWNLTGSPAPNGLEDLFGQTYILDQGNSLGQYITQFRRRFFVPCGFGSYDWKLKQGADLEIHKAIKPLYLRLDAADYLELPEVIFNTVYVDLPDKAMALYKEMESEMIAEMEGERVVTALSAAAASMKCRQIASGGLYYNDVESEESTLDRDKWQHIHDTKTEAVESIVEELSGQSVLIAYEFKHDLDRLRKLFGKDVAYIGGGVTPKRSVEIERLWNADQLPVLLGQPQSMAHGLNLQGGSCRTIIWYSTTWNYELYDQFIKRIARQGSKHKKIMVHHIVARNTIDEAQMFALRHKGKVQSGFLDALRVYVKNRK